MVIIQINQKNWEKLKKKNASWELKTIVVNITFFDGSKILAICLYWRNGATWGLVELQYVNFS